MRGGFSGEGLGHLGLIGIGDLGTGDTLGWFC